MEERRQFTRLKTCLTVFYKELNGMHDEAVSRLVDVSREGVRLLDQSRMRHKVPVELKIVIPGDAVPVVVSAESVWCEKTDDYFYRKGMRFTEIYQSDLKRLLDCAYYESE